MGSHKLILVPKQGCIMYVYKPPRFILGGNRPNSFEIQESVVSMSDFHQVIRRSNQAEDLGSSVSA